MKITVGKVLQNWKGINIIYQVNDLLPGPFDYHMVKRNVPILQKEVKSLEELSDEEFEEIKETEIELPLSMIKPNMLPEKMPKGAIGLIDNLIIEEEQPEHESAVSALINSIKQSDEAREEAIQEEE